MNEPTKREIELRDLFRSGRGDAADIAAYREELLAASAQSAEPQEAEAVLRRYIKGNSPIDWDRIKPLIDAYAVARLASKPSRSEAPELDEAALADTAYGPSGYNPGNEWQNCRDMINHIQWQYHKHAGDSGVDEATENALASLDLLHKHYAARPSREEEMRTVLAEIERYARASLCDHRGGSPDVGSCPNCKSYLHIIELARAALAQGGARDGGEKR